MPKRLTKALIMGALCSGLLHVGSAFADETRLRMETVDAGRPAAMIMTAFADIVSANVDDVQVDVFHGGIDTLGMMALGRGVLHMSMVTPVAYDLMAQSKGMFAQETVASELSSLVCPSSGILGQIAA